MDSLTVMLLLENDELLFPVASQISPSDICWTCSGIVAALSSQLAIFSCSIIILSKHAGRPVGPTRPDLKRSSYYIQYKQNPHRDWRFSRSQASGLTAVNWRDGTNSSCGMFSNRGNKKLQSGLTSESAPVITNRRTTFSSSRGDSLDTMQIAW